MDPNQTYKVVSAEVFKTGQTKTVPVRQWTIYKVTLEGYNGEVTGFDAVNPGDLVTLEEKQNGQYTNTNYKKFDAATATATATAPAQGNAPAPATGEADKRPLKLLVAIAEQIGVAPEAITAILDERV